MSRMSLATAEAVARPPAPGPTSSRLPQKSASMATRVGDARHLGDRRVLRHHRRVHARLDAALGARRDAEQLDAIAHVLGRLDVGLGDRLDALDVDLVEGELGAEGEAGQDARACARCRSRRCRTSDRPRRSRAPALPSARRRTSGARSAIVGEDVIAGAVEDAVDARHLVGGERLAQRLDDGDAAGDRRLEVERDALLLGELRQLDAVLGEQRLVGGDDVLAGIAAPLRPPPWRRRRSRRSARRTPRCLGSLRERHRIVEPA